MELDITKLNDASYIKKFIQDIETKQVELRKAISSLDNLKSEAEKIKLTSSYSLGICMLERKLHFIDEWCEVDYFESDSLESYVDMEYRELEDYTDGELSDEIMESMSHDAGDKIYNAYASYEQAESCIAFGHLTLIADKINGTVNDSVMKPVSTNYYIVSNYSSLGNPYSVVTNFIPNNLPFKTKEGAELMIEKHKDLLDDWFCIK